MVINASLEDDQSQGSMEIETKINHQGEVLKVKNMPQQEKSHIIATKAINGEINIYDYSKIKGQKKKSLIKPDLRLRGHSQKGYALDWSNLKEGFILSGAHDYNVKSF
jgi:histone-binding protein RBBP4